MLHLWIRDVAIYQPFRLLPGLNLKLLTQRVNIIPVFAAPSQEFERQDIRCGRKEDLQLPLNRFLTATAWTASLKI